MFTTATSNAEQNTTRVESWAQNLTSPHQSFPIQLKSRGFRDPDLLIQCRPSVFSPNQFESQPHFSKVSHPLFWNSIAGLWFATAEQTFFANDSFNQHKRFSMALSSLDWKLTEVDNGKPTEMLLIDAYDIINSQTNKVLRKLYNCKKRYICFKTAISSYTAWVHKLCNKLIHSSFCDKFII